MNIASAKNQIKDAVEAYLRKDDAGMYYIDTVHQRPIFLLGAPGIGKTAIMEQIAQELQIGIVSYSMTHHTRQSALGLPRIEHHEFEGYEYEASEYTMSEIVAAVYDYMERTGLRTGILFLDEINCVSETLYPSMLQFLQFKTFGKHRIPDDWIVVCAGNPPEYNRSVHEFDIVTLDRLREIEVTPDYGAWKAYATSKGLHPAVTTFLEAKQDCFYKVESKPGGGKAFVTARGWEDMAKVISLYEDMDKVVNRDLIVQFLRDDDIADQFSVYYSLFEKYRSDYQVGRILSGDVTETIKNRAREAAFDERIALLGLLLDAISGDCNKALDQEAVVVELRDLLRQAKPELLAGATVEDSVQKRIAAREYELGRRVESGVASNSHIRKERLVIRLLRAFVGHCTVANTPEGEAAFSTIQEAYKAEVAKIQPLVEEANKKIDNAFDFVDETLGNREILVFVAELTTRQATTQFIAHYGNEKYYEHNDKLKVDAARSGLSDRIEMLDSIKEIPLGEMRDVTQNTAAGLSLDGRNTLLSDYEVKPIEDADYTASSTTDASTSSTTRGEDPVPFEPVDTVGLGMGEYYGGKQFEYGFASMSKMTLEPAELKGLKVLDVCCRRGKGCFKLSAHVGAQGHVLGVDWSPSYVEDAKADMERAWRKNGLKSSNMDFRVAYPEDLIAAGVGSSTMDVVYINNVMTLLYDQQAALKEFNRVLKPGGLLIMETIFADKDRDLDVVVKARGIGNSVQAALTQEQNYMMLQRAGFGEPTIKDEYDVAASRGFISSQVVDVIESDEDVSFKAVAIYVRKA